MYRYFTLSFCLLALTATLARAQDDGAEEEVRAVIRAYVEAFNDKDLAKVSAIWDEAATHVDRQTGEHTKGRVAIIRDLAGSFRDQPEARLSGSVDVVCFIKPDVAQVEGQTVLSLPGGDQAQSVFTAICVKTGDTWVIHSIDEHDLPQPESPAQALSDLEWMIGRWVDEGDESRVTITVRWTANKAFLLRSHVIQDDDGVVSEGTQVVGWDPRSRHIRSWSFLSDGSFQDGVWHKVGDDWLIMSSCCLADGRAASGTYVLTPIDANRASLRLIGHEIEGAPQPTEPAVEIVRVPAVETTSAGATDSQ